MMDAIVASDRRQPSDHQRQRVGFKGFIPAVFARLVDEEFGQLAKGEAEVKVTAPPGSRAQPQGPARRMGGRDHRNRNCSNRPGRQGQALFGVVETNGRPAFRVMVPEYYAASCLACHGCPKGEMDITGYPKEGGKMGDLGCGDEHHPLSLSRVLAVSRMMARLTIRTRLILLTSAGLIVLIATNAYLNRKLGDNSAGMVAGGRVAEPSIEQANDAQLAFGEMRYWMTDLAVSQLTLSESNAAGTRARMEQHLDS